MFYKFTRCQWISRLNFEAFFFIRIQSENFRKSFRNRRVSTVQIPMKLCGNHSQCQIMNLDLMFSMKPVNITFILPNNFNCFLSVLETLLTIPRYENHFIVNPRSLIWFHYFETLIIWYIKFAICFVMI